jgi:SAM-dependent methyltransferase
MMSIFTHPSIANIEMGSPNWFAAQREMIRMKPAVERCYDLWYSKLLQDVSSVKSEGAIVELGSGSSYIKELSENIFTSDVVTGPVDMVLDGRQLPFADNSVKALLLTHVFHHIPNVSMFLKEAERVLVPGGVISLIDCAHTPISKLFFHHIHPEPYVPTATKWSFPPGNTMLSSNQALTWIVFVRDKALFTKDYQSLQLEHWSYLPWLSYLLSGGVNLRSLVPQCASSFLEKIDNFLKPIDHFGAIHWHLTIRKT